MSNEIPDELTACMEQLRWLLAGYRAGGILDWRYKPGKVASRVVPETSANKSTTLFETCEALAGCERCRLHSGRTNLVFGEGSTRSGLVFVGEGPGFDEDRQGRPFVGRAGKLLDKMIRAIGFEREEVYICNVVKCRPPDNRTPLPDEIAACSPFLFQQIEALKPKIICALGACASQTLLGKALPISQTRGKIHLWRGTPLICTFHPAYLLRNAAQKAAAWQDLKEVLRVLGSAD
jgi:DNA polymerase